MSIAHVSFLKKILTYTKLSLSVCKLLPGLLFPKASIKASKYKLCISYNILLFFLIATHRWIENSYLRRIPSAKGRDNKCYQQKPLSILVVVSSLG